VLAALGDPQRGARGALVAGTNGKGSTCAFLAAILEARGLRTGTMPSPHLGSYSERIQISGRPLDPELFAAAVAAVRPAVDRVAAEHGPPTEFEVLTAAAVAWLAPRCDRLAVEVGMGGRLDSTNVLDLGVAVITNVSLDHQHWLGDTVEEIAREKAAIVKPGNQVITGAEGAALRVIEERCAAAGATLWRLGEELRVESRWRGWEGTELDVSGPGFEHRGLQVPLLGSFQARNAALAVAAAQALGDATPEAVAQGIAAARWPGRLEVIAERPRVILDGAHNEAAMAALVDDLSALLDRPPVVVFAAMRDKDLEALLGRLRRLRPPAVLFTRAASAGERAADPWRLAELWGAGGRVVEPAADALAAARGRAGPGGTVVVCGTLYLAGELRSWAVDA